MVTDRSGLAAVGQDSGAAVEPGAAGADAAADDVIRALDPLEGVVAPVEVGAEFDRSGRVGFEAEYDHVVRRAGEDLAAEADVAEPVLDGGDAVVEVERAAVAGHELLVVAAEEQGHVGEHLVARLTVRHPEHRELGERVRLLDLAGEQQAAHLGQGLQGVRVVALVRPARPDALLVEDTVSL